MLEEMPIIPLYFYVSQHLIKPWVSGLEGNVMDHHYSKYVKILKTENWQEALQRVREDLKEANEPVVEKTEDEVISE